MQALDLCAQADAVEAAAAKEQDRIYAKFEEVCKSVCAFLEDLFLVH